MLNGQNSVKFLRWVSFWFSSLFTSLINNPLDSGAIKYLLHEFIVLPGRRSIVTLDSIPSSGRNLSISWLLHKISLLVGAGNLCRNSSIGGNGNESESLSAEKKRMKLKLKEWKSSRDRIRRRITSEILLLDHLTENHSRFVPILQ